MSSLQGFSNSEYYVKDTRNAYWLFPHTRIVAGADVASFKAWGADFAVDKNYLYITGYMVPDADPFTFDVIRQGQDIINFPYFKDKNSVFFKIAVNTQKEYHYGLIKVEGADPKTIRAIGDSDIIADDTSVYFEGKKVPGLDGKTFAEVDAPYFSDKNGFYFNFTLLSRSGPINILTNDGGYVTIGNQVFMGTSTIIGADPKTFHVFDGALKNGEKDTAPCNLKEYCFYAADNNFVYYNGKRLDNADARTFTLIGYGLLTGRDGDPSQPEYAKDSTSVYYQGERLNGADPKTFTPLISGGYYFEYGGDAQSVYWKSKLIEGADPKTFTIFGGQQPYEGCGAGRYSKDAVNVYYQNAKIEGADPKTFKIKFGDDDYGEDAQYFYKGGNKADPKEFKECNYG